MFSPTAGYAAPDSKINRWSMFVPAFAIHVSLGAPYAWSAISSTLTREFGFVASSSADWALPACTYPMSIMIATGGAIYGLGWLVVAGGVHQHSLPLIYAGNLLY